MAAGLLFVVAFVVVAVAIAGVALLVSLAVSGKRSATASNEVVPGMPSSAPDAWAGAHTPEALLHRRLVDVVAALRAVPGLDGMALDRRSEIERHALELDQRLVAVASLPIDARFTPLGIIEGDIKELEMGVAALTVHVAEQHRPLDDAFAELAQRLDHLEEARNELDAVEPHAPWAIPTPSPAPAPAPSPEPTPAPQTSPPQSSPPQTNPPTIG